MSYQKVWNNDSGDLSTLLPFSIIWVNCNPPFCLWISIFFSNSLFFFFKSVLYPLESPPKVWWENCEHSLHTMPNFSFSQQWNSSMQQAIYKSKRETGENETESNTYPHSESILSRALGQSVSQVYNSVLTARWSQYDAHLFICSSLYFVQFTSKYSSSDWNEKKYLRDYTIIYVWCVQAFSELILGDIPV